MIERVARRKLLYLHAAKRLEDLRVPPANHLEALKGDRAGQHSICINDHGRICWRDGDAYEVEIVDYHRGAMTRKAKLLEPIHPGEILNEEFIKPLGISINRLSRDLHVPPNRIHGIVHGTRAITADTALRLARYFGTGPETWLNLQSEYELRIVRRTAGEEIARTVGKREAA